MRAVRYELPGWEYRKQDGQHAAGGSGSELKIAGGPGSPNGENGGERGPIIIDTDTADDIFHWPLDDCGGGGGAPYFDE